MTAFVLLHTAVKDGRPLEALAALSAAFDRPVGFLVLKRLVSPGGQCAGFLCLLDEEPRAELTDEQDASLQQIANAGKIMPVTPVLRTAPPTSVA